METINSQIEIKKENNDSKLKKAFKKLKNAFVVGTATLMITCGGTETTTDSSNDVFSSEMKQHIQESELGEYREFKTVKSQKSTLNMQKIHSELNLLCNETYPKIDIEHVINEFNGDEKNIFYLKNKNDIEEFLFKSLKVDSEMFNNILDGFKHGDIYFYFMSLSGVIPSPGLFYVSSYSPKNLHHEIDYLSGFNYLGYNEPENKLFLENPYFVLCNLIYREQPGVNESVPAFGRMLVIPNSKFWQIIDNLGISHDEVIEEVSINTW